jgi:hypothetical protein
VEKGGFRHGTYTENCSSRSQEGSTPCLAGVCQRLPVSAGICSDATSAMERVQHRNGGKQSGVDRMVGVLSKTKEDWPKG